MLTKKLSEDAKRPGATCYECERLNTCQLKKYILAKDVTCSNYAAEGCIKYKGENDEIKNKAGGKKDHLANRELNKRIREFLLSHKTFKLSMCQEWGMSRKTLHNNLFLLKKRGYDIQKQNVGDDVFYKINL